MKLIVLGCGTSTGVPVIGCRCRVCSSLDPKNNRTRSSAIIEADKRLILIDTSTDLRHQALSNRIPRIDAVLFTHPHADHIHGIDELRSFNMVQGSAIPCFGSPETIKRVKLLFEYIFVDNEYNGWKPDLTTTAINGPFKACGIDVVPVPVLHGSSEILGFRVGGIAYITDCSSMPAASIELLRGVEVLVLGALRHKPHPSHFTVDEAIDVALKVAPRQTILTHLGHTIDYLTDGARLPRGIELAYDGMCVDI